MNSPLQCIACIYKAKQVITGKFKAMADKENNQLKTQAVFPQKKHMQKIKTRH